MLTFGKNLNDFFKSTTLHAACDKQCLLVVTWSFFKTKIRPCTQTRERRESRLVSNLSRVSGFPESQSQSRSRKWDFQSLSLSLDLVKGLAKVSVSVSISCKGWKKSQSRLEISWQYTEYILSSIAATRVYQRSYVVLLSMMHFNWILSPHRAG